MVFDKVAVIGLGYIGLPTAAMFASRRKNVLGVDINPEVVNTINQGQIHIVEPELDMLVHAAVTEKTLRASTVAEEADAFLIAVPTPFKDGYQPDLSFVEAAAKVIAPVLDKGNLVILESTCPVGATEQLAEWLAKERPDLNFPQSAGDDSDVCVAHCPERVLPGSVVRELVENDRVIGGITPRCSALATELYKTFVTGVCIETNSRTAEMAKLTENSFRDVNIAFANELSLICDELNIDVWELIRLANRHPRVSILQPGPGVGGHCIAVDPWFIVAKTPEQAKLISTARLVNDSKPEWVIGKVKRALFDQLSTYPKKTMSDVSVACFGLAFKPDIDDLRESPALKIVEDLASELSCQLLVVEPNIERLPDSLSDSACLVGCQEAVVKADVIVILVDHKEFKELSVSQLGDTDIVDTKGLFSGI